MAEIGKLTSKYEIGDVLDYYGSNDVYLGTKTKYWDYEFTYENDGSISSISIDILDKPKTLYFFCIENDDYFYGTTMRKNAFQVIGHKDVPSIDERIDGMIERQGKCKDMSELDYNYWVELHLNKWHYSEEVTPKLVSAIKELLPDAKIISEVL